MPKRILVVEDNYDNRRILEDLLSHFGYEVLSADGGARGLALARQHLPDLILLDLAMPEMDGWEVLRRLREDPTTARVPVCIVSAHVPREYERLLAADLAADCYLIKPLPPSELLREVVARIGDASPAGDPVGGSPA